MKQNPSFGLAMWGPLVPASDCRPCLLSLAAVQMVGGLALCFRAGKGYRSRVPNYSRFRYGMYRVGGSLIGFYFTALSFLEISRVTTLKFDPWVQQAATARAEAEKRGEKVSRWFGPETLVPLGKEEWDRQHQQMWQQHRERSGHQLYEQLRDANRNRAESILQQLQNNVKFDVVVDEPELDLDKQTLMSLSEEVEWDVMDAWEYLQDETDIAVRFMIHTRQKDEDPVESVVTRYEP